MAQAKRNSVGGCSALFILLLAVLATIVVYFLSVAPARWLEQRGYLSQGTFQLIYFPISMASRGSQWFGDAVQWYCGLWGA